MIDSSPSSFADTQPRQLVTLVSMLIREPCENVSGVEPEILVVQTETEDFDFPLRSFYFPTDYILEGVGMDICPFADMFAFSLQATGPVLE